MSFQNLPDELRLMILQLARKTAFEDKIRRFEEVYTDSKSKWVWQKFHSNRILWGYGCTLHDKFQFAFFYPKAGPNFNKGMSFKWKVSGGILENTLHQHVLGKWSSRVWKYEIPTTIESS